LCHVGYTPIQNLVNEPHLPACPYSSTFYGL
jgi:hypothetical protein